MTTSGPRILVTRPAGQAGELAELLAARDLDPVSVPTVEIESSTAGGPLDAALSALDGADWLVITSVNGAAAIVERLAAGKWRLPAGTRIAAVGPASAQALQAGGLPVHHVPDRYLTVAIADGLGPIDGRRVVLARADTATPDLREALVARGALVEEVVAYRTVEGPASSLRALEAALRDRLHAVAFTSGSTVRGMDRLLAGVPDHAAAQGRRLPAFCIGPVTARVAREAGWSVGGVADEHTAEGLAELIADHFVSAEVIHT